MRVSVTTDAFSRFVDLLVSTLDDHEATGEALASRVHLSRYHFDRLVAAAAVEPPVAFRRRILLERAAYRLAVTDESVLTIAVDAGYSRAMTTIIDSNLTTLIAALFLYLFGSGPVRGFAVTLSIGIVTSMFTAISLTRLIVVLWLKRFRPSALPI